MPYSKPVSAGGFTLVELLIVMFIIAILATIAVPNLLSAKSSSHESSAISTLRNLSSVQIGAMNRNFIDVDADGKGEFGFFGELSAGVPARNLPGAPLLPPLLAASFQSVNAGAVAKSGYMFMIYLPDNAGAGVSEAVANYASVDPDNAEIAWCAYAWPAASPNGRVFFINQQGELLFSDNSAQSYAGLGNAPPGDAAYVNAGSIMGQYVAGQAATDGGTWKIID